MSENIKLNNNVDMPLAGFDAFQVPDPAICEQAMVDAIRTGYRLMDTADSYQNEEAASRAVRRAGAPHT